MNDFNNDPKTKLVLKNVFLVYKNEANEKDGKKFNRSISVRVDKPEIEMITKWVKDNNIGSGDKAGVPQIMTREFDDGDKVHYFYFWPSNNTEYTDSNGIDKLSFEDLTEGSTISLVARAEAYDYTGKNGVRKKGVAHRLTSVVVMKAVPNTAREDTKDLLDELSTSHTEEKTGDVDLSEIPF